MHNVSEASKAVFSTFPYYILIKKQSKMTLDPSRHLPLHVSIKSLLKTMQKGTRTSKAVSFTVAY